MIDVMAINAASAALMISDVPFTTPVGAVRVGLINGDFIKPDGTTWDYEPGRFEIARHLELLRRAGFASPSLLATYELNTETPTAAQNYACLIAER